jgi:phage protein U
MINVMMLLGDYPFMLNTAAYDSLKRSAAWRWKTQNRLSRKPAMQYIGPDAHSLTFGGFILPQFKGGLSQTDLMREEADKGTPLLLVDGRGFVWGEWVITQLDETQSEFLASGVPKRIDFTISLSEYGADEGSTSAQTAHDRALTTFAELL